MKARGEVPPIDIERVLGVGGEAEIIPLFIPSQTYQLIREKAAERGCTAAEWIERAIMQYASPAEEVIAPISEPVIERRPAIMIKRRK